MRRFAIAVTLALVSVTACGGDDDVDNEDVASVASNASSALESAAPGAASSLSSAASEAMSAATSAAAEVSSAAASAVSSAAGAASSAATGATNAAATCQFLEANLPKLKEVGSSVGALAQLTGAYLTFVSSAEGGGGVPNAAQLDEMTKTECPQVRDEVLKVLEKTDFASAF